MPNWHCLLETTVRVVERQREKFPFINYAEIMEWRVVVGDPINRIMGAKGEMQSEEVKQKEGGKHCHYC